MLCERTSQSSLVVLLLSTPLTLRFHSPTILFTPPKCGLISHFTEKKMEAQELEVGNCEKRVQNLELDCQRKNTEFRVIGQLCAQKWSFSVLAEQNGLEQ